MRYVATSRGVSACRTCDVCYIHAGLVPHHVTASGLIAAHGVAAVGIRATRSGLWLKAIARASVLVRLAASADFGVTGWIAKERRVAGSRDRRWTRGQGAGVAASIDVWWRERIGCIALWSDVRLVVFSKDAAVKILIGATNDGDRVNDRIPRGQRYRAGD